MRYHDIKHDDMNNGDGLRVVLFVSGCEHHCKGCHNPQTWDKDSGNIFDDNAKKEIFEQLSKDYIDGITLSGGDPLAGWNIKDILSLVKEIREKFPSKSIWLYTGYTLQECKKDEQKMAVLGHVDVLCDGEFKEELRSPDKPWVGSSNQNVIFLRKEE